VVAGPDLNQRSPKDLIPRYRELEVVTFLHCQKGSNHVKLYPAGGIPLSHRVSPSGIATPDIRGRVSAGRILLGFESRQALASTKAAREHWRQRGAAQMSATSKIRRFDFDIAGP
jgi:hypothetical protein